MKMNQNTFVTKIVKIHYFPKKASKIIFVAKLKFCNNFFYTISTNKFFRKLNTNEIESND